MHRRNKGKFRTFSGRGNRLTNIITHEIAITSRHLAHTKDAL
jgi:hypothetical protein